MQIRERFPFLQLCNLYSLWIISWLKGTQQLVSNGWNGNDVTWLRWGRGVGRMLGYIQSLEKNVFLKLQTPESCSVWDSESCQPKRTFCNFLLSLTCIDIHANSCFFVHFYSSALGQCKNKIYFEGKGKSTELASWHLFKMKLIPSILYTPMAFNGNAIISHTFIWKCQRWNTNTSNWATGVIGIAKCIPRYFNSSLSWRDKTLVWLSAFTL